MVAPKVITQNSAITRDTGSAGSVKDGYSGKGGDEMWCITPLQPKRSSHHWEVATAIGKFF